MSKKVVLIWFRNDLRLHDNEILVEAIAKSDLIIPVYCFDPRYYSKNQFNQHNTGTNRAKFILESVKELKDNLQALNSDLMTFVGYPEDILPGLCTKYAVDEVYHHREVASRETQISERVETALWEIKINLKHFIGHTLFHKEDLPFPIKDIPDKFNVFRKKIERESTVRDAWETPTKINSPSHLEHTAVPNLNELGYQDHEIHNLSSELISGGEESALTKLQLLLDPDYMGEENFTFISPYIAVGALSPIFVYHQMQKSKVSQNKKKYERLMIKLFWRDYFRFMLKKYPNVFFKINNDFSEITSAEINEEKLTNWKNGSTGEIVVDNLIKILKEKGNLTYAARRLISKYFLQEVGSNWLVGAAFFEEYLLDYAPASTYGFWSHLAGSGTSMKENTSPSWQEQLKRLNFIKE